MKTYGELEVGDTLYVLTEDMAIIKTQILRVTKLPNFIAFRLIGDSCCIKYTKYIRIELIEKTTSLTTATNLKDIKRLKAQKVAELNTKWRRGFWRQSFFI